MNEVLCRDSGSPYDDTCKNGYNVHRYTRANGSSAIAFAHHTVLCMSQNIPMSLEQ